MKPDDEFWPLLLLAVGALIGIPLGLVSGIFSVPGVTPW